MGKGNRLRQQPEKTAAVAETHEPPVPVNWPEGHVSSAMTGDDDLECIVVTVHGVRHYLHATTARELVKSVTGTLDEWNAMAREWHEANGTTHVEA